jgi:hypothetical protein
LVAIGNLAERVVIAEKTLLTRQLHLVEPIQVAVPGCLTPLIRSW